MTDDKTEDSELTSKQFISKYFVFMNKQKSKAIPVTGRGGP
jgi:hypothetical protein